MGQQQEQQQQQHGRRLDDVISYFASQARHHLQQYQMYCYYAKYYNKCKQQLYKRSNKTSGRTTDSSCGYYFKTSNTSKSKKRTKRRNKKRRERAARAVESSTEEAAYGGCGSVEVAGYVVNDRVEVAETMESSEESDGEIDVGYQEFMRQSEQFRKERDAVRVKCSTRGGSKGVGKNTNEEDETPLQCVEYVDVLRKGPDGTILPPTASNRKQLYEEKYGSAGTKILSLETALQLKFNSVIDSSSPKPWPALPIRFVNEK